MNESIAVRLDSLEKAGAEQRAREARSFRTWGDENLEIQKLKGIEDILSTAYGLRGEVKT